MHSNTLPAKTLPAAYIHGLRPRPLYLLVVTHKTFLFEKSMESNCHANEGGHTLKMFAILLKRLKIEDGRYKNLKSCNVLMSVAQYPNPNIGVGP